MVSPTCNSHIDNEIPKVIAKTEKRMNDTYSYRIKEHLGGDFYPFILTSGEAMTPLENKIIKQLAKKIFIDSFIKESDIVKEIQDDISMSLIKSRIQGLRCN